MDRRGTPEPSAARPVADRHGTSSLTVIVPTLNGRDILPRCLEALCASDLPREGWELVVVDDGSSDDSAEVAARWADRVVRVTDGPRGPGYARNRGAEVASGGVLAFIDADVVVHEDTLRQMLAAFDGDDAPGAVFGAYDDSPAHPSFLSQYRNLLHRYVHLRGAGEADTFWAGCGAVRTEAFRRVGGFDATAYPRPQIEDIELGYRLRDAGYRIVIRPEVQAKHLKQWTFGGVIRTDLFDRAIPWVTLILRRGDSGGGSLNITRSEKVRAGLLALSLLIAAIAILLTDPRWAVAAALTLAILIALNWPVYRWFARLRGWGFALRVIPMHLLYYLTSGVGAIIGHARHALRGRDGVGRPGPATAGKRENGP